MHGDLCPAALAVSGTQAKKRRTKASRYFVTLDLFPSNARQEYLPTVLTICLLSGLRSSLLRLDREVHAGTSLCW